MKLYIPLSIINIIFKSNILHTISYLVFNIFFKANNLFIFTFYCFYFLEYFININHRIKRKTKKDIHFWILFLNLI